MGRAAPPAGHNPIESPLQRLKLGRAVTLPPPARFPDRAHAHSHRAPERRLGIDFLFLSFSSRATLRNLFRPTVAEAPPPSQGRCCSGLGCISIRMWSRSRPAGTLWRGGARRRARGQREGGPWARALAGRREVPPLPTGEEGAPAVGRPPRSEELGEKKGRQLSLLPAAFAVSPGLASPGPLRSPRSRPGESVVSWRPSL